MASLFADDGCILPNIPTQLYRVDLSGDCAHTKIRNVLIYVEAPDAESARRYATETLVSIPRTHVNGVWPVSRREHSDA